MPEVPSYEQLLTLVGELSARVAEQDRIIAEQTERMAQQADRIAELEHRLGADSSNSSRPPSSDAPWEKARAKKRSSRTPSGRSPGKQPGAASWSRSLVEDPDRVVVIEPARCGGCRPRRPSGRLRRPFPPDAIPEEIIAEVADVRTSRFIVKSSARLLGNGSRASHDRSHSVGVGGSGSHRCAPGRRFR